MRCLFCLVLLCLLCLLCSCDLIASSQLESSVVGALESDERTKSYSFEVSHQGDGKVLITGEVTSDEIKAAVTEIASAVDGVNSVVNRCSLPEDGSNMMQDTVVNSPFL